MVLTIPRQNQNEKRRTQNGNIKNKRNRPIQIIRIDKR